MAKSPAPRTHLSFLLIASLVLAGIALAGCGSSMTTGTRQLQSLTVTPASADAQASPGGQVQFTATGNFNMAPMQVMSPAVLWSIGPPFPPSPMGMMSAASMAGTASVSAGGLAQCNGFVGAVTVQATAPQDPNMPVSQMNAMTMMVAGTAQMKCP